MNANDVSKLRQSIDETMANVESWLVQQTEDTMKHDMINSSTVSFKRAIPTKNKSIHDKDKLIRNRRNTVDEDCGDRLVKDFVLLTDYKEMLSELNTFMETYFHDIYVKIQTLPFPVKEADLELTLNVCVSNEHVDEVGTDARARNIPHLRVKSIYCNDSNLCLNSESLDDLNLVNYEDLKKNLIVCANNKEDDDLNTRANKDEVNKSNLDETDEQCIDLNVCVRVEQVDDNNERAVKPIGRKNDGSNERESSVHIDDSGVYLSDEQKDMSSASRSRDGDVESNVDISNMCSSVEDPNKQTGYSSCDEMDISNKSANFNIVDDINGGFRLEQLDDPNSGLNVKQPDQSSDPNKSLVPDSKLYVICEQDNVSSTDVTSDQEDDISRCFTMEHVDDSNASLICEETDDLSVCGKQADDTSISLSFDMVKESNTFLCDDQVDYSKTCKCTDNSCTCSSTKQVHDSCLNVQQMSDSKKFVRFEQVIASYTHIGVEEIGDPNTFLSFEEMQDSTVHLSDKEETYSNICSSFEEVYDSNTNLSFEVLDHSNTCLNVKQIASSVKLKQLNDSDAHLSKVYIDDLSKGRLDDSFKGRLDDSFIYSSFEQLDDNNIYIRNPQEDDTITCSSFEHLSIIYLDPQEIEDSGIGWNIEKEDGSSNCLGCGESHDHSECYNCQEEYRSAINPKEKDKKKSKKKWKKRFTCLFLCTK